MKSFRISAILSILLAPVQPAMVQGIQVPVIVDGEAQIIPEFEDAEKWIRHDLWVETEFDTDGDGKPDRVHVDVVRPLQTDTEGLKLPVIYESSPYFAGTSSTAREYFWDVRHEVGAVPPERTHPPAIRRRGRRPIISNSQVNTWVPRGFIVVHSSSPGTGLSQGSPTVGGDNESLAPKAVIDWLGEDIDYLYDFIHSGNEARRAYSDSLIRDIEMAEGMDRVTGDYNEFWAGRDYLNDMAPLKAAVLMSHGFNDWNVVPEHSYRIYEALKEKGVPAQIFYHQGGHGGAPPQSMMNRWFTRYLFGIENGVEDDPRAWIVREDAERTDPTPYEDYPNPAASPVTLYLTAGAPEQGKLVIEQVPDQGTESLIDNFSFSGAVLAQAEWTDHRLLYVTPELTEAVHLSGVSSITIRLSSSKPAANLSVWLVSLPWTEGRQPRITDNLITRGWADPQNYRSLTESEPLVPGRFYTMTFNLQPDDQIIPAGQQIGLMIFSSDREFTLWPDPGTVLTIDLDATSIELPIVGGVEAFERRELSMRSNSTEYSSFWCRGRESNPHTA